MEVVEDMPAIAVDDGVLFRFICKAGSERVLFWDRIVADRNSGCSG